MRGRGAYPNLDWTPALTAKLLRLRSIGLSCPQIAERFVTTKTAIRKKLRKLRAVKCAARSWDLSEVGRLQTMLASGKTEREIAHALERTPTAVHAKIIRLRRARKVRGPSRRFHFVMENRL